MELLECFGKNSAFHFAKRGNVIGNVLGSASKGINGSNGFGFQAQNQPVHELYNYANQAEEWYWSQVSGAMAPD